MRKEIEQNIAITSEVFTSKRNAVRVECLRNILPPSIDAGTLSNFLGGETLQKVRARAKEFPLIMGGNIIYNLSRFLTDSLRSPLEEQFGDKSYLRKQGDDLIDKSEILTGDMITQHTRLWGAYWNDASILLADHVGHLRMDAIGYKVAGESVGPIVALLRKKLEADIKVWLQGIRKDIEEIPGWLERKGLSKQNSPKTDLDKKVGKLIIGYKKSEVDQLVAGGVDPAIAEARVLAAATTPRELDDEAIAISEERLAKMQILYPKLQEEAGRLAEVINEVIGELINKDGLTQITETAKFASRKR